MHILADENNRIESDARSDCPIDINGLRDFMNSEEGKHIRETKSKKMGSPGPQDKTFGKREHRNSLTRLKEKQEKTHAHRYN